MAMTESNVVHRRADVDLEGGQGTAMELGADVQESTPLVAAEERPAVEDAAKHEAQDADADKKKKKGKKGKQGRGTILFLNGLRGLASLLVVEEHGKYWEGPNLGAVSVDTFFVLSAFLLTMIFEHKSRQLLAQRATFRQWMVMLVDYFSKRFFRVYPLFAAAAIFCDLISDELRTRYLHMEHPEQYKLFEVLTFKFEARYHVFWTLPVEIGYYFLIPVFVFCMVALGRRWWALAVPLYVWVIHEGLYKYRTSHFPLAPHIPTFLAGSLAAFVYARIDGWIRANDFEFSKWQRVAVRVVEGFTLCVFLSVAFRGLFFHWVYPNPVPSAEGFPFVSVLVTVIMVIEMVLPSALSRALEWNFLCFAGQISFSMYLLHSFVIYTPEIMHQNKYDRFFLDFGLTCLLSTVTYWLIEYPSTLGAQRMSKFLNRFNGPGPAPAAADATQPPKPPRSLCDRLIPESWQKL